MSAFVKEFKESYNGANALQKVAFIILAIMAFVFIVATVSLLSGVLTGTPSGENIPLM